MSSKITHSRGGIIRQVLIITLLRVLINTARRFVYPFVPVLSRSLDVPLTAITSIIAAGQLTSLCGAFTGAYADRLGYRLTMRAGLAMVAGGMLICSVTGNYWPVAVGLVLASFGKTVFDPAVQAFIAGSVPFARRGRVIGILETAWAGSTLIGIPALAVIIDRAGLAGAFCLLAVLGFAGWLIIGRIIPADVKKTSSAAQPTIVSSLLKLCRSRRTGGMLAFGFWISVANDSLFVVYGAWFEKEFAASIITLGFSTVAIGCAELAGEGLTALFADRIGLRRMLAIGLCLAMSAYLLLPMTGYSLATAMGGMFCVFLFFELTMVTSFSLSTELLPQARATMMGGFYAASGVGRVFGVLLGGVLWSLGGITLVCWSAACLTGLGLLSMLWGLHGWHPE